jgi:hypothetical protein
MDRLGHIATELKEHVPFTAFGAGVGIAAMTVISLTQRDPIAADYAFHILHPAHMLLSSIVTAAMFRLHRGRIGVSIIVGLLGAIAVCTISDVALPYLGGAALGALMVLHLDILEKPWLLLVPALVGATIGAVTGRWTKCPHAAHVLISTLASSFYLMAFGVMGWFPAFPLVFVVLFVAVWIPCCTSDIVFPLLFTTKEKRR